MIFPPFRLLAEGLACRRGGRTLFENLAIRLESGAGLTLVGPNGAGKTSLLRLLAGLLTPTAGNVRLEPAKDIPLTEQSHFIGVRDGLKAAMTPREHMEFWRAAADAPSAAPGGDRTAEGLRELRLEAFADTPCGWLSTGQRRRVALARLFGATRAIWLLDEPLNGLDGRAAEALAGAARRHREAGGVLVAASHQPLGWEDMTLLSLDVPASEQSGARTANP